MAEFERALIQERVRAGLRNARANGKRIGRPQVKLDSSKVVELGATPRSVVTVQCELAHKKLP